MKRQHFKKSQQGFAIKKRLLETGRSFKKNWYKKYATTLKTAFCFFEIQLLLFGKLNFFLNDSPPELKPQQFACHKSELLSNYFSSAKAALTENNWSRSCPSFASNYDYLLYAGYTKWSTARGQHTPISKKTQKQKTNGFCKFWEAATTG